MELIGLMLRIICMLSAWFSHAKDLTPADLFPCGLKIICDGPNFGYNKAVVGEVVCAYT
jgi:hypothetical protein